MNTSLLTNANAVIKRFAVIMRLLSFAYAQDRLRGVYPEPVEGILAMTNKLNKRDKLNKRKNNER